MTPPLSLTSVAGGAVFARMPYSSGMTRDSEMYSSKAERAWREAGEKLCMHPSFSKDGNAWGPDDFDYFCLTCGAIKVGRNGEVPLPRGHE